MGLFDKIKQAFQKTREVLGDKIAAVFTPGRKVDQELLDELEEILLSSDVGIDTSEYLIGALKEANRREGGKVAADVLMRQAIVDLLKHAEAPAEASESPRVIMVIGVNGTGKTTSVGKLVLYYKNLGKQVMLCAADTFRAAAIDQLQVWGERSGAKVIAGAPNADSAAVAYDALEAALSKQVDVLLIDTAGRLHNKSNLMKELEKISRVLKKRMPSAPHEVLLVLDATTGQNGLNQAMEFAKAAGITGLVLTKIDGTAKGGVILAISRQMSIPIRYVGFGESLEDLAEFSADKFAESLLGDFARAPTVGA
ncbi:signal recognition particle-docking protein FtsY [candidate division KSB1 bacterium]|nr:signal recognition particle-docking protein FtsY [candidate division KSB1 bacterium]